MSFTAEQLADLKSAYASGALIVRHGDKTTEFRTLSDMKKLIAAIEKDLAGRSRSKKNFLGGEAITPAFKDC